MTFLKILKKTKQRAFTKKIYGFDIETYNKNKNFLMATIYGDDYCKTFTDKQKLINEFKKKIFENSYVCATNLQFDFFGTFFNTKDIMNFTWLFRGSDLIFARTYIQNRDFIKRRKGGNSKPLYFIDTMSYAKLSVDNLGKILGIPKLKEQVSFMLGRKPKNKYEFNLMKEYNIRDAEISQKIIKFLFASFNGLGATPKLTIASTSMSLYKNRFLHCDYIRANPESLLNQFNAYYGGNTHAYSRGRIKDYYYYDFNSLYPSVMKNEYPNPNSMRETNKDTDFFIDSFEGVSKVDIKCPYMEYPFLPYKYDVKLIFPYGNFTGWYSHVELRRALELGYEITKVYKTIYYKETCYPFVDYIDELYKLRLEYKDDENPMELVVKLLMNSLYGKFGQKFLNRDNWFPFNMSKEELNKYDFVERFGDFIRVKNEYTEPSSFCIPIWALYTTAYARMKLHTYINRCTPIYVDTDSLITRKRYYSSNELGKLKLETYIKSGIIVKPKFYMINNTPKIKGIGTKITKDMFLEFLKNPSITYDKFMKFKESVRRGFIPNEIIDMTKTMNLEDDKRFWDKPFDYNDFQISKPIEVINGIPEREYTLHKEYPQVYENAD